MARNTRPSTSHTQTMQTVRPTLPQGPKPRDVVVLHCKAHPEHPSRATAASMWPTNARAQRRTTEGGLHDSWCCRADARPRLGGEAASTATQITSELVHVAREAAPGPIAPPIPFPPFPPARPPRGGHTEANAPTRAAGQGMGRVVRASCNQTDLVQLLCNALELAASVQAARHKVGQSFRPPARPPAMSTPVHSSARPLARSPWASPPPATRPSNSVAVARGASIVSCAGCAREATARDRRAHSAGNGPHRCQLPTADTAERRRARRRQRFAESDARATRRGFSRIAE